MDTHNGSAGVEHGLIGRECDCGGWPHNRARPLRATLRHLTGAAPLGFEAGDANFYRYVRNSPLDATDPSGLQRTDARITSPGTPVPAKDFGGGEVKVNNVKGQVVVRTGVNFVTGTGKTVENGISIEYHGLNCGQVRIVQFVWRDVRVFRGDEEGILVKKELDTTIGKYDSTTDVKNPNYRVDSASKSPLYLSRGQGGIIRNKTENVAYILDKPSNFAAWVQDTYYKDDATVTKIVAVGHYDWFLYQEGKPIYHVSWTSTATWEKGLKPVDPIIQVTGGGANEGPNPQQLMALKAHNPDYADSLTHIFTPKK
jgi:hypothetical protein